MARLSIFPFSVKSSLARFALAGFFCISLSAIAFAGSDRSARCAGAELDVRIAGCTEVIARGNKETKRNRVTAYINRATAYRVKGDFGRALADLAKSLRLDPKSTLATYRERVDLCREGRFRSRHRGVRQGAAPRRESDYGLRRSRRAHGAKGEHRQGSGRFQRGCEARSESRPRTCAWTAALFSKPRVISSWRSPITTRRSNSIRNSQTRSSTGPWPIAGNKISSTLSETSKPL